MTSTHESGIAAAEAFVAETGVPMYELRRVASDDLSRRMREQFGADHGFDIGSSDTSIHLSHMALHQPEELFGALRPLAVVARHAKTHGVTYEAAKADFARLFAPAED